MAKMHVVTIITLVEQGRACAECVGKGLAAAKSARRTLTAPVAGAMDSSQLVVAEGAKVKSVMEEMHLKKIRGGITIPV